MFQKYLFFNMLIIGTLLTISSNSWLLTWVGLEINLISFIPLIISTNNFYSNESTLIYFIFQTLASMIFLLSFILYFFYFLNFFFLKMFNFNLIMLITLMMKMGSAPFHFWMPLVMENLNWINNFILLSWQKIAPMILCFYCLKMKILILFILLSSFISSLSGLNQTSLRKLMAFSSINQISWLLSSLLINKILWKIYFFIYVIILLNMILIFKNLNLFYLNQLFSLNFFNKFLKLIIMMNVLSMGGLPPFMGFFSKLLIIQFLLKNNMLLLIIIMMMFSLIMLYFYIRIMYSSFLINNLQIKNYQLLIKNNNNNKMIIKLIILFNYFNNIFIFILLMNYFL